jgi:Clostripain family
MPTKSPSRPKANSPNIVMKSGMRDKTDSGSKRDWNILFYLIGDGLISASMISQLKAITDAGFEENTNVLVYFDPNCNGKNARIFEVNGQRKKDYINETTGKKTIIGDGLNSFVRDIAEDCHIPCLPQIPAEITLRYFLEYARAYYPANNYMLFLMGHGVIVGNDAFLPDPDDNSAITMSDLGWILRTFADKIRAEGDEFHLIGFHSCSMSSAELLYELAGSARYMLGTQGAAFPGSWPYRQLLKKIFLAIDHSKEADSDIPDQETLVNIILDGLQNLSFYNGEDFWLAGFSSDISLCSLNPDHVDGLRQPIEELSLALQKGLQDPSARNCIRLAHLESQSYWQENYTDLFDFCSCLWERCDGENEIQAAIREACANMTLAINGEMPTKVGKPTTENGHRSKGASKLRASAAYSQRPVVYSDYYGPAYQFSNGLSIYFPWRSPAKKVIQTYRDYKFTRDHGAYSWLSFLEEYFRVTQRQARSTRRPWRSAPDVENFIPWRVETNLLRTLSDQRLLALGPPPPKAFADLSKVGGDLSKVGGDLSKVGGNLLKMGDELPGKVGGELSKVGGELSKVGGDLSKVGGELSDKVGGELSKVGGDLSKLLGELSKVGGDLSDKVGAELSDKVGGDLAKLLADLSKVGGDLSKVGGDLSSKVGGDLSKVGGELSKVGGDLSKVGGDLSSNGGGGAAGGSLSKVGGDLSKVGGELGGFYGYTVIKNFASPEDQFVTSRPDRIDFNDFERWSPKNFAGKQSRPDKGRKR